MPVRVGRIELPSRPWQGRILPLNHTRLFISQTRSSKSTKKAIDFGIINELLKLSNYFYRFNHVPRKDPNLTGSVQLSHLPSANMGKAFRLLSPKADKSAFSDMVPIKELNWNGILRNIREIKDLLTVVLPEAGIIPDFSTIYA